jgi:hypothetical protein
VLCSVNSIAVLVPGNDLKVNSLSCNVPFLAA